MILLLVTMNKNDIVRDVSVSLEFDYICLVSPWGRNRVLAVLWKQEVVKKLYESSWLIDIYVENNEICFFFVFFYGNSIQQYQHHLWKN